MSARPVQVEIGRLTGSAESRKVGSWGYPRKGGMVVNAEIPGFARGMEGLPSVERRAGQG